MKNRNKRSIAGQIPLLICKDYILYLMLVPAVIPILLLYAADLYITFYGGTYLLTTLIICCIFAVKSNTYLKNQENIFFTNKGLVIFFITFLFSFFYSLLSKYLTFNLDGSDAGIFMSMIRDMSEGKYGYATSTGFYHIERHQNYILALLSIIYSLSLKSMSAVIFCNSASIMIAGIFLYKIARIYFSQLVSIIIVYTFFASPLNSAYSGFYPEIYFVAALTILAYSCLSDQKWYYVIMAACFLITIKEEAVLYMPGFLFLLLTHKRFKLITFLFIFSIMVALFNIKVVEPYYFYKNIQIGINNPNIISTFFGKWGTSYGEIVKNVFFNPLEFILYCFNDTSGFWSNYKYWFFLPLLSPFVVLSSIFVILLDTASSSNQELHAMINYHSFGVGIIAFIGIVLVINQFNKWFPKYKQTIVSISIFFVLLHNLLFINFTQLYNQLVEAPTTMAKINSFMRTPIDFLWWRAFYKINFDDATAFNNMANYLSNTFKNTPICASNKVYNNLLSYSLPNLQKRLSDNAQQNNYKCVFVFSYDSSGLVNSNLSQTEITIVNELMKNNKCNNFDKFYICNNL